MISMMFIILCFKIAQCTDTIVGQIMLLAAILLIPCTDLTRRHVLLLFIGQIVLIITIHHCSSECIHDIIKTVILTEQSALNLIFPLFYFIICHAVLLIISQHIIFSCWISIIELIHFVDQVIILCQEILNCIINSIIVCRCDQRDLLICHSQCIDCQSINGECIGIRYKSRTVQYNLCILSFNLNAGILRTIDICIRSIRI